MSKRHAAAVIGSAFLVFGLAIAAIVTGLRFAPIPDVSLLGATILDDREPAKQMPIPGARVTATLGRAHATALSNSNGFFRVAFPGVLRLGRPIYIDINAKAYQPFHVVTSQSSALLIARLKLLKASLQAGNAQPRHTVANVRVRYTVHSESFIDIGTIVRTFSARNTGNQACGTSHVCSPNGDWKAARGHLLLDAGEGNRFRSPRVSCIAGPCPFTRVESETLERDDRILDASALDWSDTTTFLVEADVLHAQATDRVRQAFPVVFGSGLSFTLPATAAGPIIQAELDGESIFFPLGPALRLSWATCTTSQNADHATLYACELKPGYRFQ